MPRLDGEGVRAVLVGTGSHAEGSLLPDVPSVAPTLTAVRRCVTQALGIREGNVTTLLDPAGPEPFLDAIIAAASSASELLLLYYVGHGVLNMAGQLHLATRATVDVRNKAGFQALAYSEIVDVLRDCAANSIIVVLDCCFSARARNPTRNGALLASAGRDENALAPPGETYTAFSGELVRAVEHGVPTAPPQLTLLHLHDHLSRVLQARNRPVPLLQTGGRASHLVLAENRAYRAPDSPDDAAAEPLAEDVCPYRGLDSYTAEDAHLFFGREALVGQVVNRLKDRSRTGGITVVTGPSGSGKTSLLAAGVLPAITHGDLGVVGSSRWPQLVMTPGTDPVGTLSALLAQRSGADRESLAADPRSDPGNVRGVIGRFVLVVDQLEEIFADTVSEADRATFLALLDGLAARADAADPAAVVVLGLRSDFYGECARYPILVSALENNQVVVGPMTPDELRSAITEPAARAGLVLEPGLVELLLTDVGAGGAEDHYDPGVLPLLSHALLATWQRRGGNRLTVRGYRETGGVSGAVATTADETFGGLSEQAQAVARDLILRMVDVGTDRPDVRRRLSLVDLDRPGSSAALEAFVEARLVTVDRDTAQITHEALIRAWPRLRSWITADLEYLAWHRRVEESRRNWADSGQDSAALLRGTALATALDWLRRRPERVSDATREYIDRSHARQRWETRRWRVVAATLTVLFVATSVLSVVSTVQGGRLGRQLAAANAQNLAAASDAHALDDPVFAAKLALAAWRSDPSNLAARNALAREYLALRSVDAIYEDLTDEPIQRIAVSPDGTTVALAGKNSVTVVQHVGTPSVTTWQAPDFPAGQTSLISPTIRWLATRDPSDGALLVWDLAAHAGPYRLPLPQGDAQGDFGPRDDRFVTSVQTDHGPETTLWDLGRRAGTPIPASVLGDQPPTRLWLTDDPAHILVQTNATDGSIYGQLTTRRLSDGAVLHSYPPRSQVVRHGEAVLTCLEANLPGHGNEHAAVVAADTAAPLVDIRYPDTAICPNSSFDRITTDEDHLLFLTAFDAPSGGSDTRSARLVSLSTGAVDEFTLPPGRDPADTDPARPEPVFPAIDSVTVIDSPAGIPPLVLVGRDGSLLRVAAARDWCAGQLLAASCRVDPGTGYLVAGNSTEIAALDATTGQRLGHLDLAALPTANADKRSWIFLSHAVGVVAHSAGTWSLTEYPLPTFAGTNPITLPSGAGQQPGQIALKPVPDGTRIYAMINGLVSAFDVSSRQPLYPPLTLGATPGEQQEYRGSGSLFPRPHHPDQVAVRVGGERVDLWSLTERRRLSSIHTPYVNGGDTVTFDESGDRMAVLTTDHTLQLWDVTTQRLLRPPIPVPNTGAVHRFRGDGSLLATDAQGTTIQLIDPAGGTVALPLPTGVPVTLVTFSQGDTQQVSVLDQSPIELPLTAGAWSAHLCRAITGPFTAEQASALPPGVDPATALCSTD